MLYIISKCTVQKHKRNHEISNTAPYYWCASICKYYGVVLPGGERKPGILVLRNTPVRADR